MHFYTDMSESIRNRLYESVFLKIISSTWEESKVTKTYIQSLDSLARFIVKQIFRWQTRDTPASLLINNNQHQLSKSA